MSTLRFAGDLSPIFVAGLAVAAAVFVMLLYLRESRRLPMPYAYLLPALRASAVVLVILILTGPVWHRRQDVGELGRVVFAVDASESMSMTDSSQSESPIRLERALRMLSGDDQNPGWLRDARADTRSRRDRVFIRRSSNDVVQSQRGRGTYVFGSGRDRGSHRPFVVPSSRASVAAPQ